MTLGKIERFWKTIYLEFLSRAQFESFEDAAERIRQWVKYYNHKRPHQGIGGLCPADRYFEIQSELRKTIEQGIQDNLLEMALRGKPRLPFYMVGRMEGQSVVLRAEKGKLRLSVDDEEDDNTQEVVYNLDDEGDGHGKDGEDKAREEAADDKPHGDGEVPGGPGSVDGEAKAGGCVPGDAGAMDGAIGVAESGDGGNAPGPGAQGEAGQGAGPVSPPAGTSGQEAPGAVSPGEAGKEAVEGAGNRQSGDGTVKGPEPGKLIPAPG
jgi:hypothetical protein